jgi:hypothetical protein
MADVDPAEALSVTYQGIACLPSFSFRLTQGLSSSGGYVEIPRRTKAPIDGRIVADTLPTIKPTVTGVDTLSNSTEDLAFQGGHDFIVGSKGDLVIEAAGAAPVTFKDVYVTENGVEASGPTENDTPIYRFALASFEYLWGRRGLVVGWVNVRKNGATQTTNDTGTTTGEPEPLDPRDYVPGSLKDGRLWTLQEVLFDIVLPQIIGRPGIVKFPESLEGDKAIPTGHIWPGVSPVKAFQDLLTEFDIVVAPRPDGHISIFERDTGEPQDADGKDIPDDIKAFAIGSVAHRYVPIVATVMGAPIIQETRARLEPVGEVSGEVIPLADALSLIGAPLGGARDPMVMAFDTEEELIAYSALESTQVKAFKRWAFKAFRLPGGVEENAWRLPMLARPALDGSGVRPIMVEADGHTRVDLRTLFAGGQLTTEERGLNLGPAIQAITDDLRRLYADPDPGPERTILIASLQQRLQILQRERRVRGALFRAPDRDGVGRGERVGDNSIEEVETGLEAGGGAKFITSVVRDGIRQGSPPIVYVSDPVAPAEPTPSVNVSTGVVIFDELRGRVAPDVVPVERARLADFPEVYALYSYSVKPDPDAPMSLDWRYVSHWGREESGAIIRLAEIPEGAHTFRISRADIVQVNRADGATNRGAMDTLAKREATQILGRVQSVKGARFILPRLIDAVPTGKVSSVSWSGEPTVVEIVSGDSDIRISPDTSTEERNRPPGWGDADVIPGGSA